MAPIKLLLLLLVLTEASLATQYYTLNGGGTAQVEYITINGVQLPSEVRAYVSPATTRATGDRANFRGEAVERRMTAMGFRRGDERGHIIASALGGTNELWNLAPQTPAVNANRLAETVVGGWYTEEQNVLRFVGDGCGAVLYRVSLEYSDSSNPTRPSMFRLTTTYYRAGVVCNNLGFTGENRNEAPGNERSSFFLHRDRGQQRRWFLSMSLMTFACEVGAFYGLAVVGGGILVSYAIVMAISGTSSSSCPVCSTAGLYRRNLDEVTAVVFKHANFEGAGTSISVRSDQCQSLPGEWEDVISSIIVTPHECLKLWYRKGCRGDSKEVRGYLMNMEQDGRPSGGNWNDEVASVSGCSYNSQALIVSYRIGG